VDSAGDAVTLLHVQLGQGESSCVDGRVLSDVTGGGLVEHVADDEALHGLVLGDQTAAVEAVHGGGATTSVLETSSVTALEGHI